LIKEERRILFPGESSKTRRGARRSYHTCTGGEDFSAGGRKKGGQSPILGGESISRHYIKSGRLRRGRGEGVAS